MSLLSGLKDLLFPRKCPFCRKLLAKEDTFACGDCAASLPFTEGGGLQPGEGFSLCAAPLYYEGEVRQSLLRYKFGGASSYDRCYGALLAACIREALPGTWDLITWTPLSRARLRERGYDQARLLARAAAEALGAEAVPLLVKAADTPKQSQAGGREQRKANIAGAYRVSDPARVRGKRILLIDDIVTTGSTLSECSRTLLDAGAGEIFCAALARAREARAD